MHLLNIPKRFPQLSLNDNFKVMSDFRKVVSFPLLLFLFLLSCKGQSRVDDSCYYKYKLARNLVYVNYTSHSAMDSALQLLNECMGCDSIRVAVVDLKIRILVGMKKYAESINFINSLSMKDFTYSYKQKFLTKEIQVLEYRERNDTIIINALYQEIVNIINEYISDRYNMDNNELMEVYTDLFTVKEMYMDENQINKELEELKRKYPQKKDFFEFLKKK